MMLFGELKNGGTANITLDKDQLMIVAVTKATKPIVQNETTEISSD